MELQAAILLVVSFALLLMFSVPVSYSIVASAYRNRKRERVRNGTPRPRRLWQIPQCHSFRYGA